MASAFQNRLVGTVVLVAAAVLVLPELLDGKKATLEEQFATIPLRPTVEVAEVSQSRPAEQAAPTWQLEPQQPSDATATPAVIDATVQTPSATKEASPSVTKPKPTSKPKAVTVKAGWSLRLGSFKNADNVNRLVTTLRKEKYPAYTIPKRPVAGQLTVVMVGPDIDKKMLERYRSELAKKIDIKGTIVRYDPLTM